MGDALKHSIELDNEENAKEAYIEAVINYLTIPTEQNKTISLDRMFDYNTLNKGNILKELQIEFEKLNSNDHYYWKMFNTWAEQQLFYRRPELRVQLLEAAQNRKIGSYKWTI